MSRLISRILLAILLFPLATLFHLVAFAASLGSVALRVGTHAKRTR